jgi:hypothetical protein
MELITLLNEENELDQYIFIVHTRSSKYPSLSPSLYLNSKVDKITKK